MEQLLSSFQLWLCNIKCACAAAISSYLYIRRSSCEASGTLFAWSPKFGAGQDGLRLHGGVSDTGGVPEALAVPVPKQRHQWVAVRRIVFSYLSYIRIALCLHSGRFI